MVTRLDWHNKTRVTGILLKQRLWRREGEEMLGRILQPFLFFIQEMDWLLCFAAIITISNILICIWGDTKSLIFHVVSTPDIYCHIASVYTWQFGILKMHKMHIMGFAKEGMHSCIPALYVAPCLHVAEETFVFQWCRRDLPPLSQILTPLLKQPRLLWARFTTINHSKQNTRSCCRLLLI